MSLYFRSAEEIIEEFIDLIDENKFETLYRIIDDNNYLLLSERGRLGKYFHEAEIYPLLHNMTYVPTAFLMDEKIEDEVIIPTTITEIRENAFRGNLFKKIIIPDSVTCIRSRVFASNYNLRTVILSKNITELGSYIFRNCPNLYQLDFNGTVREFKRTKYHKRSRWIEGSSIEKIVCTDGIIELENRK